MMKVLKIKDIVLYASILVFVVSLTQNSYCTSQCGNSLMNLLFGWLGILIELGSIADKFINPDESNIALGSIGATFSWLANPALLLAWMTFKGSKNVSLFFASIALAFMISFLFFSRIVDNEAGHYNEIVDYKAGYWLWLSSSLILVAGIVIERFKAPMLKD